MRRLALVLLIALAVPVALASCAPDARAPAVRAGGARRAPVVVTIVVDQLAAWVIDERIGELPKSGGFARLAREGTRAREMRFAHAATDTAPGHAALYTGEAPRDSGIFGNETVDEPTGKRLSVLSDPRVELVTADGPIAGAKGSSAARAPATCLATLLRKSVPDAYIASVSLKDRGAIFAGGASPNASVWYDVPRGTWVTSTAFARALPAWARGSPLAALPPSWTLADPAWVKAHAATPDDQPGEGDYGGLGTTFPHPLGAAREPNVAFRATPMANDALVDLALAALADPAAAGRPTLLAISFSANDYVGHTFGPDSWEAWDELYRLDGSLARLFAALDARFGQDGWSAVLSADHGVTRMPEAARGCSGDAGSDRWQRPCDAGARILPDVLARELDAEAVKLLGPGHWISGIADPYVYFTHTAQSLDGPRRQSLEGALRGSLLARPGVRAVYVPREVAAHACPPDADESEAALVCRSVVATAGGELYVVTQPGSFFDPSVVVGKGTSHGSPYLFDRAVPLFVRAPGRALAGAVLGEPIGFAAFARTAASLLGIDPPPGAKQARDLAPRK